MDFAQNIQELIAGNLPLAFGIAFVSGFITSLTPCVYPVIGITVAVFGGVMRVTERLWSSRGDLSVAAVRELTASYLDAVRPALAESWRAE